MKLLLKVFEMVFLAKYVDILIYKKTYSHHLDAENFPIFK